MEYPPIKINPLDPNGVSTSPSISEEELDHEVSKNDLQRRYYEVYFTCFVGTYHTTKYNLLEGDFVIVQADRGHDVGVVSRLVEFEVSLVDEDHEIVSVVPKDEYPVRVMLQDKVIAQNQALEICRNKCVELLISTHIEVIATEFQFDRKKLTLYYKKHSDVSVCKLIRKLYNIFKMRIWMEPIDVELCNDSFSNITTKFLSLSQITIPPQEKTNEFIISPQQQQQQLSSSSQQSTSPTTITTTTTTNTNTNNINVNSPTNINMNHINSTFSSISIPSSTTTSNVSTPGNTSPVSAPFAPITPPTPHFTQKKNEIGTPVEKLKKTIIEPRRDMSTVENNMSFPNYVQLSQHQNVPTNIQQQQQQQIHQSQQSQSRQIYQGLSQSQSTFTSSNLTSMSAGNNLSGHNNANNHNNNSILMQQQQQQNNYHLHQQQQQQQNQSAQYYRSAADQVQYSSRYNSKVTQERITPRSVPQQQQQIIRSSNYTQQQQQQKHTPIGQPSVNYNSRDPSYNNNNGYYEGQYQYQQTNQNHNYLQQQTSAVSYQDYDPHYRQQQQQQPIPLTRQERIERYVEMIDDRLFQGTYQKSNHNDGYYHNFNQNTNNNINKNSNHHNINNNNNNINQKLYHNYQPEQKYQEGNYRVANTPHQSVVHEDVGRYLTVDFLEDDIFTSTSIESSCDYYNFMPQSSSSTYYPTHGQSKMF